jgi:hypothetical protein
MEKEVESVCGSRLVTGKVTLVSEAGGGENSVSGWVKHLIEKEFRWWYLLPDGVSLQGERFVSVIGKVWREFQKDGTVRKDRQGGSSPKRKSIETLVLLDEDTEEEEESPFSDEPRWKKKVNHVLFTTLRLSQTPTLPAKCAWRRSLNREERICVELTKQIALGAMKCHSDTWFLTYSGDSNVLSSKNLMRGVGSKKLYVRGSINHTAVERFFMKGEFLSGDFGTFYMNLLQERQWRLEQAKQTEKNVCSWMQWCMMQSQVGCLILL